MNFYIVQIRQRQQFIYKWHAKQQQIFKIASNRNEDNNEYNNSNHNKNTNNINCNDINNNNNNYNNNNIDNKGVDGKNRYMGNFSVKRKNIRTGKDGNG